MKEGSRTDEELLAAQTDEVMETSELTQLQIEKLLDMQTAGRDVGPIKANSYMQNARMSARTWDNIDSILWRIIIIAKTLREDSDGDDARTKLQTLHEDVCQDQALGPAFLAQFNQYFDIADIHDSEYRYYFRRAVNGTEHTQLRTSMCDYFCEKLDRQARAA